MKKVACIGPNIGNKTMIICTNENTQPGSLVTLSSEKSNKEYLQQKANRHLRKNKNYTVAKVIDDNLVFEEVPGIHFHMSLFHPVDKPAILQI